MNSERRVYTNGAWSSGRLAIFAAPSRRVALGGFLWLFGLYAVFLASAPMKITPEKLEKYHDKLKEAENVLSELAVAQNKLAEARFNLREVKVWNWRWKDESYKEIVYERQAVVDGLRKEERTIRKKKDAALKEAKQSLGLWSEAGIEESRALLWDSFNSGKSFATRQTFWDSIVAILDSRDRSWLGMLLELLFASIMNYTVGAILSMITFMISLPSFLASFGASLPSAVLFFIVALIAAASLVLTYIFLIFAAGASVVMTTVSFIALGLENAERRRLLHRD